MIEVAYVEQRISDFKYKVRIPKYQKLATSSTGTATRELPTAYVCTTPGCRPSYNVGDVVWVAYEQGNIGIPVIVGQLYRDDDGGTFMTLSDKVELLHQTLPNYEERFQILEQRSDQVQNGNISVESFNAHKTQGFLSDGVTTTFTFPISVKEVTKVTFTPQFAFKQDEPSYKFDAQANKITFSKTIPAKTIITVSIEPIVQVEKQIIRTLPYLAVQCADIESGLKELIAWICTEYPKDINALYQGHIKTVSSGLVQLIINNNSAPILNGCTGTFTAGPKIYLFGYNNSNWYFKEIS